MTKELDDALCAKYPEIFRDRHTPMNQTLMCWGFDCGDGWYALIDTLCETLMGPARQARCDVRQAEMALAHPDGLSEFAKAFYTPERLAQYQAVLTAVESQIPVALQVKEKFGTLRFYLLNATDEQQDMVDFAEMLSGRMCEDCGATKDTHTRTQGWWKTQCPACAEQAGFAPTLPVESNDSWAV